MCYIITIKGEAKPYLKINGELKEVHGDGLESLDGIDSADDFVQYIDNKEIANKLGFGYMSFEYDDEDQKLYTVTEYSANRYLDNAELAYLARYTSGQWSDGIGEGFEQRPCAELEEGIEVFISPWFSGQIISYDQKKEKEEDYGVQATSTEL